MGKKWSLKDIKYMIPEHEEQMNMWKSLCPVCMFHTLIHDEVDDEYRCVNKKCLFLLK